MVLDIRRGQEADLDISNVLIVKKVSSQNMTMINAKLTVSYVNCKAKLAKNVCEKLQKDGESLRTAYQVLSSSFTPFASNLHQFSEKN